jgi:hypothetical protein
MAEDAEVLTELFQRAAYTQTAVTEEDRAQAMSRLRAFEGALRESSTSQSS